MTDGLGRHGHRVCVFGVLHFLLFKFAVTAALGVVLAYLCWQSRSIVPGMIAHLLHNTIGSYSAIDASWRTRVGIKEDGDWAHLPAHILIAGGLVFVLGLLAAGRAKKERVDPERQPVADLGGS